MISMEIFIYLHIQTWNQRIYNRLNIQIFYVELYLIVYKVSRE